MGLCLRGLYGAVEDGTPLSGQMKMATEVATSSIAQPVPSLDVWPNLNMRPAKKQVTKGPVRPACRKPSSKTVDICPKDFARTRAKDDASVRQN